MNGLWDLGSFGKRTALKDDSGIIVRYDELEALQSRLYGEIGSGQLTMMLCKNSIGAVSGYAALLNSGNPMILVSATLTEDRLRYIMDTYRPVFVYAPQSLREEYADMREISSICDYVLLRTNYHELYPVNRELGLMLSTSGSTGSVKFVRQSRENIRFNARVIADYLDISDSERTITSLPMDYTYGLSVINSSLLAGAAMVVTSCGIMDEEFWKLFENEQITAFHGVPNTYGILHRLGMFRENFPDLRLMTLAGGKPDTELHRFFAEYARKYGKRFIVMYGQCEATAAVSYLPAEMALEKAGSVGIAIQGGRIGLVGENGAPVEKPFVRGELVYHGANVTLGYASCGRDLIKGDERNGELYTGDIAEFDEDGFLYIRGRLKRFIKISGHRISLDEIDEKIMNDIHVRCISSGTDNDLVIFVLSDSDGEAVRDYIKKNIGVARTKFRVVKIDEFPTNEAGKILYGALNEMGR